MNVDVLSFGIVVFFAIVGALTGAARQISRVIAVIGAVILARQLGPLLTPWMMKWLSTSAGIAALVSSVAIFLVTFWTIRFATHQVLLRTFAGHDAKDRGVDRGLGFALGGLKAAGLVWFFLCAMAFVEDNVAVGGKKMSVAPKNSTLIALAREHNLFEKPAAPLSVPTIPEAPAPKQRKKSSAPSHVIKEDF